MILTVGGTKGGTGKTTIATCLAARRAKDGKSVVLIDADHPQYSSEAWGNAREEAAIQPSVTTLAKAGKDLRNTIRKMADTFDDVIIDVGGSLSPEFASALAVSDKVYVPIQASQYDLDTMEEMDQLLGNAYGPNPDMVAFAFINRGHTNPGVKETDMARDLLQDFEYIDLSPVVIKNRQSWSRTSRLGVGIDELPKGYRDPKAERELEALYQEVFGDE